MKTITRTLILKRKPFITYSLGDKIIAKISFHFGWCCFEYNFHYQSKNGKFHRDKKLDHKCNPFGLHKADLFIQAKIGELLGEEYKFVDDQTISGLIQQWLCA